MDTELGMKFVRLLILFVGIPVAIYFAKNNIMDRKKYLISLVASFALFGIGANLAQSVHMGFFILMLLGVWLFYFASAQRYMDAGKNKWYSLLSIIPTAAIFVIGYLLYKPSQPKQ
jgi:uncharacterized membrane protein YhaH (DUF805 family)